MRRRHLVISIPLRPGRCRWCGCSDLEACDVGCAWANRAHTLCTACAPLDLAMRTIKSRAEIAVLLQEIERDETRWAPAGWGAESGAA